MREVLDLLRVPAEGAATAEDPGLFGADSMVRRVNRQGVLVLGGGRALILQVAHPLVAAGVGAHSSYREDPWGRLYRTLEAPLCVVFGNTATAERAAERVWNVHGRVNGELAEPAGRFEAGTAYSARDPELAMWVHATLVDTALVVYRRYVGGLSADEARRYYEDMKLVGERFGVPIERQPATLDEFDDYFAEMIEGDRLAVTGTLRDVFDTLRHPAVPLPLRPLGAAYGLVTTGLLPERLRRELGLRWTPARRRLVAAERLLVKTLLPVTPRSIREFGRARAAA